MPVLLPVVAETPGLVSIDTVRRALFGGDGTEASDNDALLEQWIADASALFESQAGQEIRSYSVTAPYTGRGTDQLFLRYWPVTAVSTLEYRSAVATWTTIDSALYDLLGAGRDYRLDYPTGFGRGTKYRVTMTVGYDAVPDDVAAIVCEAVVHRYLDNPGNFGRGRMGIESEATTGAAGERNVTTRYSKTGFATAWIETVLRYQKRESV
jgi:hypothetical protein